MISMLKNMKEGQPTMFSRRDDDDCFGKDKERSRLSPCSCYSCDGVVHALNMRWTGLGGNNCCRFVLLLSILCGDCFMFAINFSINNVCFEIRVI